MNHPMNKSSLILLISIVSSLAITGLLYSAGMAQRLVVLMLIASSVIIYSVTWIVIEFVIFRDAVKLRELMSMLLKGSRTKDLPKVRYNLKLTGTVGRDIRLLQKRKENEIDKLHEMANFRTQFIADISHELKTPIFAAQGYVHTLLDGAMEDKEVRLKFLKKSAKSLDHLDRMVHDLLELSQIETGNVVMMYDHFDIVQLTDEVIDDLEQSALKSEITVRRNKTPREAIVYADFIRIKQVMQNLVSNAIKYNVDGGKVTIKIEDLSDKVLISVIDTGTGIPQEDISKIFNRFYRVDKSRTKTRNRASNGLGLSIVKHLLESHNTKVEVESEIGKGSVFTFSLPKDKTAFHVTKAKSEELDII